MTEVAVSRLSSKGQIVIPKELRNYLGFHEGELFALFGDGDTLIIKKVDVPSKEELEGILQKGAIIGKKKKITRKDVLKAIAEVRKEEC
jgi:AbrB family looped-hinge helix DNA binding protein